VTRGRALACAGVLIGSLAFSGCGGADDARLSTFVGHWWGHARGIEVYRSGRGKEYIGSGAPPLATLTFDVLRVTGTPGVADARIRVTSARISDRRAFFGSLPRTGEFGTLRLRHGIVMDSITRVYYCAPAIDECDPIGGVDTDPDPNLA
jgi:hypothetical protein